MARRSVWERSIVEHPAWPLDGPTLGWAGPVCGAVVVTLCWMIAASIGT